MLLGAQELVVCVCVCVCAWKRRLFSRFQEPGALVYGESICASRVIFLGRSRTGPGRRLKGSEGIPKKAPAAPFGPVDLISLLVISPFSSCAERKKERDGRFTSKATETHGPEYMAKGS